MLHDIFRSIRYYFIARLLCCAVLFSGIATYSHAQAANSKVISQRFFMQVDDLLDLGFIDDKDAYTSTVPMDIDDIVNNGKEPEYEFRIRTNEPYMLTIQTSAEDSSGSIAGDSLLQVKLIVGDDDNSQDGYKNVQNTPTNLINDNSKLQDKKLKIKYKAQSGAAVPPELKQLNLVYTASYP